MHLHMYFRCFLSTSLNEDKLWKQNSPVLGCVLHYITHKVLGIGYVSVCDWKYKKYKSFACETELSCCSQ